MPRGETFESHRPAQNLMQCLISPLRIELMKYDTDRPSADPANAARKLIEIVNETEAVQDGRIHIEKINGPFLFRENGSPAEYSAGLAYAIEKGWPWKQESGTYVKFTQAGADLFA
jgi:hypothetical protein